MLPLLLVLVLVDFIPPIFRGKAAYIRVFCAQTHSNSDFAIFWCSIHIFYSGPSQVETVAEYDKPFRIIYIYISTHLSALIYHSYTWHFPQVWFILLGNRTRWYFFLLMKIKFSPIKDFYKETCFMVTMLALNIKKRVHFCSSFLKLYLKVSFTLQWISSLLRLKFYLFQF